MISELFVMLQKVILNKAIARILIIGIAAPLAKQAYYWILLLRSYAISTPSFHVPNKFQITKRYERNIPS